MKERVKDVHEIKQINAEIYEEGRQWLIKDKHENKKSVKKQDKSKWIIQRSKKIEDRWQMLRKRTR
jgi:hypothetical protein